MKLTFRNTTPNNVLLTRRENSYTINPSSEMCLEIAEDTVDFSLEPCSENNIRYLSRKAGIILYRHFKLRSSYSEGFEADTLIQLVSDVKKGKFLDEYERVVPFSNEHSFSEPDYSVKDGKAVLSQLQKSQANGNRTLFIFDLFDILGNSFTALLLLIIPFILIWIFGSIVLAAKICGCIFLVLFIIILIANRFLDKLKRALWKKGKAFVLRKQIFKNYNSYFDNEYITSVFSAKPKAKK